MGDPVDGLRDEQHKANEAGRWKKSINRMDQNWEQLREKYRADGKVGEQVDDTVGKIEAQI